MLFHEMKLSGAFVIEPERIEDERGFFARSWSLEEFEAHGLESRLVQCNISYNYVKGTLRGMHYQTAPYDEAKLVRCTRGAIYDVIIDLRPDSATFAAWQSIQLDADNRRMLYVPRGLAHGYLTLTDNVDVCYQISEYFRNDHAKGIRWNDPAFGIEWPGEVRVISSRDLSHPLFQL